MKHRQLTQGDLAERFDVTQATVSRWASEGRLPPPATGPAKRGIRWDESAIEQFERDGFTSPAKQKADVQIVDFARGMMDVLLAVEGVDPDAKGLAKAALRVLASDEVPLRAWARVAIDLQQCNWRKLATGTMSDVDRVRAAKVRHLLNQLFRKHGGRTNA
jgi:transcriptional regulator with XRE-family HTH domain